MPPHVPGPARHVEILGDDLNVGYARLLRRHGHDVRKVWKVMPPIDTGYSVEVLFDVASGDLLSAAFVDDDTSTPPLIYSGW